MLIDLSHPISTGMPVWPGDPEVELSPAATVAADGYNLLAVRMGSQSGTHVDAPYHVDPALPVLADLPLERFTGRAVVADVRGLPPGPSITPDRLRPVAGALGPGTVLVLVTGWSAHWGTAAYAEHPGLHPDAAAAVVAAGTLAVGIDAPSIDAPGAAGLPSHHVLAAAGAVIAENLTNLETLLATDGEVRLWLLPLALTRADGSPVRAVAEVTTRTLP